MASKEFIKNLLIVNDETRVLSSIRRIADLTEKICMAFLEKALGEIVSLSGKAFDPSIVGSFLRLMASNLNKEEDIVRR